MGCFSNLGYVKNVQKSLKFQVKFLKSENISDWDVRNVKNMSFMFDGASKFK